MNCAIRRALILTGVAAWRLAAQPAVSPKFEVVSIKPLQHNTSYPGELLEPGRIRTIGTVQIFLKFAFNLAEYEIEGPAWIKSKEQFLAVNDLHSQFYVIEGTFQPATSKKDDMRKLMQSLLADRFNLVYHREQREVKGYFLKADAKGPKLKRSAGPPAGSFVASGGGTLGARNVTMVEFARRLAWAVSAPVVDATGIAGKFDIDLRYRADDDPTTSGIPSIFTALRESLGLKVEPGKPKIDVFVVDRLDQTPIEQ